jgi:class 3 adenylate cyclase
MQPPETKFAMLGADRIAYQAFGEGPIDLVYRSGMATNIDVRWEEPSSALFLTKLASFSRLILLDQRGFGSSDPVSDASASIWEHWADDVRAVLDAIGSERAAVFAVLDAGPSAILFAATYPERTAALVLGNTTARYVTAADYPQGYPPAMAQQLVRMVEEVWGTEDAAAALVPSRSQDDGYRRWYAKFLRASANRRDMAAKLRSILNLDLRDVLPLVHAPTLVLHRRDCTVVNLEQGRYLAHHIPKARFVELPGRDSVLHTEHGDEAMALIQEFLTGSLPEVEVDRVLATVLFTDIVGSTDRAAALGDRRWREILDAHDAITRATVGQFRGRLVKTTGDGMLATFDGPGRGIRCALALGQALHGRDLDIRAGLHSGEVELRGEDIGGIAVHIGARVAAKAGAREVLVSSTVKDLVAGSGIEFTDYGTHELKGVPGEWKLFAVRE